MGVKPITNKQLVDKSTIRRDEQRSFRDMSLRGNREQTFTPGMNFDKNFAVTLKDVDTSVMNYIKNVIRPSIREANETIKVPVMYGNEERWNNVRRRGVLRDRNNTIILPVIVLKRTSVEKNTELNQGFEHDVQRKYAEVLRKPQWSKKNRYDRFSVQTNKKPTFENLVTTMPNFVNISYEFVLLTSYMEQMNILIEEFVEHSNNYWGDGEDYKFLSTVESISDASEITTDSERIIKSTFSVITNKISQIQKKITPTRVVFGFEGDATDEQVGK